MNIALVGYGNLGKAIEKKALAKGHKIKLILDSKNNSKGEGFIKSNFKGIDVCFEISTPQTALKNILALLKLKQKIVVGTTGWLEDLEQVKEEVEKNETALLYSSNFSIGVNLFFKIAEEAAKIFDEKGYDCAIHEFHHKQKKDSPSGTALTLAEKILENLQNKNYLLTNSSEGKIDTEALHVTSTRLGSVPGTHSLFFDSEVDSIEIRHTARNREGFANGAILCAEWLKDKKGLFSMEDFLINNV
ncbi:MAG: 4-hydroxy-tetrahydrodipicolinate reductase [Calditrichaeota bacterium]|nr:MAG: 4-hydroxy-tetrahydrodipicolinate reductase [Calditrichota bacterium]